MHLSTSLTILSALAVTDALVTFGTCGPEARIAIAKQAVAAINKPTAVESTNAFEDLAFSPDAHIIVNPNQLGDVKASYDRQSSVAFIALVYEIVTNAIADKYLNIDDTQTFFNVTTTLRAAPGKVFFDVFLNYTVQPCQLQQVHAYAAVPSELLGIAFEIPLGLSPTPSAPARLV